MAGKTSEITKPDKILSAMPVYLIYSGADEEWEVVTVGVGPDAGFLQKPPKAGSRKVRPMIPHEIRHAFLKIKDEADAVAFLRRCGPFRATVLHTTMRDIPEWQEFFRHWLVEGSEPDGFKGPQLFHPVIEMDSLEDERIGGVVYWHIFISRETKRLMAQIQCESALEAIGASITLDLLGDSKFASCQWCNSIFELTKDNGRQYCNSDCAHRAGQKRRRAAAKAVREREAQKQTKASKRKGKA